MYECYIAMHIQASLSYTTQAPVALALHVAIEEYLGLSSEASFFYKCSACASGNAWNTDKVFQYGYLLYAAAVLIKFRPTFYSAYKRQLDFMIADIAAHTQYRDRFPIARQKDFFDGHRYVCKRTELDREGSYVQKQHVLREDC